MNKNKYQENTDTFDEEYIGYQPPKKDPTGQLIAGLTSILLLFAIILLIAVALINTETTPSLPVNGDVTTAAEDKPLIVDSRYIPTSNTGVSYIPLNYP